MGISTNVKAALSAQGNAPVFGCRAWVNFDGSGTTGTNQTIKAGGNVASVFKNAIGDYTITFQNAMPDANYVWTATARNSAGNDTTRTCVDQRTTTTKTTTQLAIRVMSGGTSASLADSPDVSVAVFR